MVKAYIQGFKDVHFIIYDDFIMKTDIEVKRVFDFLNIDNTIEIDTNKIINLGGKQWDSRIMKDLLMGEGSMKNFLKAYLPKNLRAIIKKQLTNIFTSKADEINVSIKKELLDYYQDDIQLLEQLINKDLSKWKRI